MMGTATEHDLRAASRRDGRCELVDGEIRDLRLEGWRHAQVAVTLMGLLGPAARESGWLLGANTGFRLPNGNVRDPDLAFVFAAAIGDALSDDFVPCAPDLAIEIQSPDDRPRDLLDKVGDYLQAGTRMVWVVDPERRTVTVYRSPSDAVTVGADGALEGGDVLPGFSCRVAEVF